jgi:hypothetical protein
VKEELLEGNVFGSDGLDAVDDLRVVEHASRDSPPGNRSDRGWSPAESRRQNRRGCSKSCFLGGSAVAKKKAAKKKVAKKPAKKAAKKKK